MSHFPVTGEIRHAPIYEGITAGSPVHTAKSPAPPPPDSLSYYSNLLSDLAKRADERVDAMRALADFVLGGHTEAAGNAPGPKAVPSGLGAEMCERITAIDAHLNALAHEYGRLERAIRG